MKKQTNPPQTKKAKSTVAILIVFLVLIALGGAFALYRRFQDTNALEQAMNAAPSSNQMESITMLATAIEQHPWGANLSEAKHLVNDKIKKAIDSAEAANDCRTFAAFFTEMKKNPVWKPYTTGEPRRHLEDAWGKTFQRMQNDEERLEKLKAAFSRIVNAPTPSLSELRGVAEISFSKMLPSLENTRLAALYSAGIALREPDFANSVISHLDEADKGKILSSIEVPCDACDGKGTLLCQSCVRNPGKCPSCGGTGIMQVTRLSGKTFASTGQPCTRCKGSGQCVVCKGTGRHDCPHCKGSAKRISLRLAERKMRENLEQLISDICQQEAEFARAKAAAALL